MYTWAWYAHVLSMVQWGAKQDERHLSPRKDTEPIHLLGVWYWSPKDHQHLPVIPRPYMVFFRKIGLAYMDKSIHRNIAVHPEHLGCTQSDCHSRAKHKFKWGNTKPEWYTNVELSSLRYGWGGLCSTSWFDGNPVELIVPRLLGIW